MAISAVSSISAGDLVRLFRAPLVGSAGAAGSAPAVRRVESVPALRGRDDAEEKKDPARDESSRMLAQDPRRPESIVSDRLDSLRGEKSALERKQADRKGDRSAEVLSVISQLRSRDAEVRAHEAAHMAAGGRYVTGGATYSYQSGPDGGQYAVGGEVGIDTSPVPGDPQATVQKMRTIRAAALAPSDPSAADLSVAAATAQIEAAALAEIAQARSDAAPRQGLNVLA